MGTLELKNVIAQYMSKADDKVLRIVKAVFETYGQESVDYMVSDEHKKILDERLASHKMNPSAGRSWKEVEGDITANYGV